MLYAKETDQRCQTFEKSLQMGEDFERRTKALLLRAAMLKSNICVKVRLEREIYGITSPAIESHCHIFCRHCPETTDKEERWRLRRQTVEEHPVVRGNKLSMLFFFTNPRFSIRHRFIFLCYFLFVNAEQFLWTSSACLCVDCIVLFCCLRRTLELDSNIN